MLALAFVDRNRYLPGMIHETPQSVLRVGVARCDITPPVGIYHRMWGAATHERAAGVHRPLMATAMALAPTKREHDNGSKYPLQIILSLDHCLFGEAEIRLLQEAIVRRNSLSLAQLLITFTHTHAAGLMSLDRAHLPGGELIEPYLRELANKSAELIAESIAELDVAMITYGYGSCSLATNRDYWDEERKQFVCGFNPSVPADSTLLVARISRGTPHKTVATLVNYACHPTSLAWQNELISPDYVGALRETVERETTASGDEPAPCIFIQGASAELGPRDGFSGDSEVADANGRQLGFSALAALTALPPAWSSLVYDGPKVSGATLGIWSHAWPTGAKIQAMPHFAIRQKTIELLYRTDRSSRAEVAAALAEQEQRKQAAITAGDVAAVRDAHALIERQTRMLRRLDELPQGTYPYLIQAWRLGDAIWLGVRGELYSRLQTELRARFAPTPIVVMTLVDGWGPSYIVPQETYGQGLYQESIAILAPGSFEKIIEACGELIQELLSPS